MKNKYYSLEVTNREADIYIFGDIVDPIWKEIDDMWGITSETSGLSLVNEVKDLDVDVINVHINSYGGVVSEGLAIYNTLKNHKAKVRTIVDGFACSAASVVFMAGDERLMNDASILMIHNAWMYAEGNAEQLRKYADDLDKITQGSVETYKSRVNIGEDKIKELMDAETWILPNEALEWGFATDIITASKSDKAAASAQKALFSLLAKTRVPIPQTASAEVDLDALAEKVAEKIRQSGNSPDEPQEDPPAAPKENKTIKFLNAIFGGKE